MPSDDQAVSVVNSTNQQADVVANDPNGIVYAIKRFEESRKVILMIDDGTDKTTAQVSWISGNRRLANRSPSPACQ